MSDSASDTTGVAALAPSMSTRKRKITDVSPSEEGDIAYEPRRKLPKPETVTTNSKKAVRSERALRTREAPPNTIRVGTARGSGTGGYFQYELSSRDIVKRKRPPFQELRLDRPIAWCQLPKYPKRFVAQFSKVETFASTPNAAEEVRGSRTGTKAQEDDVEESAPSKRSKSCKCDDNEFEFEDVDKDDSSASQPDNSDNHADNDNFSPTAESSASEEEISKAVITKQDGGKKSKETPQKPGKMKSLLNRTKGQPGIHYHLPPMSKPAEMFEDITNNAMKRGLDNALKHLGGHRIRVATMCSGTESPLLALEMIRDSLQVNGRETFYIEHLFSAEIVPYKQAYIERNFSPPIIFRDITELTSVIGNPDPMATTAYGGRERVPGGIHILVAGTSCVDFSSKNAHKKGIQDSGESGDTWRAVLAYCKVSRPAIVLLENVRDAPWEKMLSAYENINYEVSGVQVDTKDYYLPQTRQRGYMICFDKEKLGNAVGAGMTWVSLMEELKRPASSPATDFILTNDIVPPRQKFRDDGSTRKVQWTNCAIRAMQYRQENSIGIERPITHWSESGSVQPPDFCQVDWFTGREERVLDFLDVAYMRKTLPKHGMYDPRYKARFFEVSQNIDRDEDNKQFGIVSCITPTGRMLISDTGREVAAVELLMLQGLPLDRISLTSETLAEIRDLAGNAMSTTVVGSAIVSALIAGYKSIKFLDSAREPLHYRQRQGPTKGKRPTRGVFETIAILPNDGNVDLPKLLETAKLTSRQCLCEGSIGTSLHPIQTCMDCSHTTCVKCGGNPSHNYRQDLDQKMSRSPAVQFEDLVRDTLPLRLKFLRTTSRDLRLDSLYQLLRSSEDSYRDLLSSAFSQTFSYQRVRRTHCWTIVYSASSTGNDYILELVLNDASQAEWRLYVHLPKKTPLNDSLRKSLHQPVATSSVTKDLLPGRWQIRAPQEKFLPITFTGSGSLISSMWSRRAMPDFTQHKMWEFLTVEIPEYAGQADINRWLLAGKYQYLPNCGTANECLYKRVGQSKNRPLYIFLDPSRLGTPEEDVFVFSHTIAKLEADEVRSIVAYIGRPWLAWSGDGSQSIAAKTSAKLLHSQWIGFDIQLCSERSEFFADRIKSLMQQDCHKPIVLMECSLSLEYTSSETTTIDNLIKNHKWVFECLRKHLPGQDWTDLQIAIDGSCPTCAPPRPGLRWSLQENGSIRPYENPLSASEYEKAVKSRPTPLFAYAERRTGDLKLELVANLHTLAHRASARLPDQGLYARYQWRLATRSRPFLFRPFQLQATTGVAPFEGRLDMNITLFPKQRLALSWMREQEKGVSVTIEESEESIIRPLGWRVEVIAQTTVKAWGGVCADHPGFGKTITSLALISSEFEGIGKAALESELRAHQAVSSLGLIPTAATLIVCPSSLVRQWVSEIRDKLCWNERVVSIQNVADLAKLRTNDVQSAKIIVVNRAVLGHDTYIERLAAFAAIPGPMTTKGRAFKDWLNSALTEVPQHVQLLQNGIAGLKDHVKRSYKAHLLSERFKTFEPSRRLRGANYVADKVKKTKAAQKFAGAAADVDTSSLHMPLFQQFYFNRIIVDEFHEYATHEYEMVTNLRAYKRWGLSGTPAINDFSEVADVAKLLSVPLPRGNVSQDIMLKKNIRKLREEYTAAEEFEEMRQIRSDAMHSRIHDMHQHFLNQCVRRNIMDFAEMDYEEALLPVTLDCDHRALHMELRQHLNSSDMLMKKLSANAVDRCQRINEVVNASSSGEEALSRHAAFIDSGRTNALRKRKEQLAATLYRIPSLAADARKREPAGLEAWKTAMLQKGGLGDIESIADIKAALSGTRNVEEVSRRKDVDSMNGDDSSDAVADKKVLKRKSTTGKNACTAALQDQCEQLVVAHRSLRYLQNAQLLSRASNGWKQASHCDAEFCPGTCADSAIAVSCGHLLCRDCYDAGEACVDSSCPSVGCRSTNLTKTMLWADKIGSPSQDSTHGAKFDVLTKLLRRIQDRDDQAILFVQFEDQLNQAESALADSGISSIVVKAMHTAGVQFETFRDTAGTKRQKTVIVLNASDETAAGSNLQNANHVIFFSPLLRDTQYGYESSMAQSIGRVRRYGQNKTIYVYRVFALNTIDVDLLEHREKRIDALVEQGAPAIYPPEAVNTAGVGNGDKPELEQTQLVYEKGKFSLRPQSWLVRRGADNDEDMSQKLVKNRVIGWEDFSSSVKFSRAFTEDD